MGVHDTLFHAEIYPIIIRVTANQFHAASKAVLSQRFEISPMEASCRNESSNSDARLTSTALSLSYYMQADQITHYETKALSIETLP